MRYGYKVIYETNDNYRTKIIKTKKAVKDWTIAVKELGGSILTVKKVIIEL